MYKFILLFITINFNSFSQTNSNYYKVFIDDISILNNKNDLDTSIVEYSNDNNYSINKGKKYIAFSEIILSTTYDYYVKFSEDVNMKMRNDVEIKIKQEGLIDSLKPLSSYKLNDLSCQVNITKFQIKTIGYGYSTLNIYFLEAKISMLNKKNKVLYTYNESYKSLPRKISRYSKVTNTFNNSRDESNLLLLHDTIIKECVSKFFNKKHIEDFYKVKDDLKSAEPETVLDTKIIKTVNNDSLVKQQLINDSLAKVKNDAIYPPLVLKTKNQITNVELDKAINSVIMVKAGNDRYSGIIVSDDGYILSTYSLLKDDTTRKCQVIFADGKILDLSIVRFNAETDLLLLKMQGNNYTPLILNTIIRTKMTNDIYAVGSAGDGELGQSISKGIISGYRVIEKKSILQLNVKMNVWQMGGGLFLPNGALIGVLYGKLVGYGVEGIGFAMPNQFIMKSLNLKYE